MYFWGRTWYNKITKLLLRRYNNESYCKNRSFFGGVFFGTAGVKILTSREAKKAYTHVTAAALRAKDEVMKNVTTVNENAGDILADAKEINEKRAADAEVETVEVCAAEENAETEENSAKTENR